MAPLIFFFMGILLVLFISFLMGIFNKSVFKKHFAPMRSMALLFLLFIVIFLQQRISNNLNHISISEIEEDSIIGTIKGRSSCFTVYLDSASGAPDYILSSEVGNTYSYSLGQVIFESEVNRYCFKVIESSEKEYYILISGTAIESVVGEIGDVTIEDSIGSQFSIAKRYEQIDSEHTLTRIIAFSVLSCWDEKSYKLTAIDNFGLHSN